MQSPQVKLKEITRLLGSWPSAAAAVDGDEQLRNYLLAVEDYPAWDVEAAVDALIKGTAPGVNPNFLPPPAVVGAECHRQNNLRCTAEARNKALRLQLPAPEIPRSPEAQARVKALLEKTVAHLSPPEDSLRERHRLMLTRANERMDAERGFSVGDSDMDAA